MKAHRLSLAVGFFFAVLYLSSLTLNFTYDGLCYALDVEFGPNANRFHPNHLVYTIGSWAMFKIAQWGGYSFRAIFLMQVVNALAAAAAVGLLSGILERRVGRGGALLSALAFGFSNAFWREAVDPGCYAWAALAGVGLVWLLLEGDLRRPVVMGLLHGVATLFHQMYLLLLPCFWLWYLLRSSKSKSLPAILRHTMGFGLVYGLSYGIVAVLYHNASLGEALYWALGPAGPPPGAAILSDTWWSLDVWHNLLVTWKASSESFLSVSTPGLEWGFRMIFTVAAGMVIYWGFRRRQQISTVSWVLFSWVTVLSVFQLFFYVGALRYRILVLPALIALIVLEFDAARRRQWAPVLTLLILGVGFVNGLYAAYPRKILPPEGRRMLWLRQGLTPQDFFIFDGQSGASIRNVYFAYFSPDLPARSLWGYLYSHPNGSMDGLRERMSETAQAGGRVWVERDLLSEKTQRAVERWARAPEQSLKGWTEGWEEAEEQRMPEGYEVVRLVPTSAGGSARPKKR